MLWAIYEEHWVLNWLQNLRFPPSSLLVFSTQHSSCHKDSWDTEGPSPSPCLLFSGKSDHPICYFAAKKAWPLNCECWEKLFSATEVRFPPAWRQQTAHCHIVTTAAQPPAEPQFISSPKLFFFFLFPLLLYPEPTSSLLRSQSFQTVCWSGGKEKKSEMSLSPRNIKSGAGKKKMFFPLINPGWVRYFVEHSRLYGKKKNMRRKKKCLPTC